MTQDHQGMNLLWCCGVMLHTARPCAIQAQVKQCQPKSCDIALYGAELVLCGAVVRY